MSGILTQALIPSLDGSIQSSHLYSFAEAFNSRILNGAGDSHWRIPYYIFSAYFRKPRIDDSLSRTPDSEFFDFYQFVNPQTGDTWPPSNPQTPEGANLQTNFLNRFIFGMNYNEKDPVDGSWLYEREDVRIQKSQGFLKGGESHLYRGRTFFGFSSIGTDTGVDLQYTAFGLAMEVHNYGYISGDTQNPAGHSYGGFYGSNPLILDKDGCGSEGGRDYPKSEAVLVPIDGYTSQAFKVCNEGVSPNFGDQYSIISSSNPNSFSVYGVQGNNLLSASIYDKKKWHLTQNQSTVFLGREQKNHIYRLLYNFITYAKGFDFDWFFNNQYCFSPEIGSFSRITATYSVNNPSGYNRKDLMKSDVQLSQARLALQNLKINRKLTGTFVQAQNTVTITFDGAHGYSVGDWVDVYLYYANSSVPFPNNNYNRFQISATTNTTFNISVSGVAMSATGSAEIKLFLNIVGGMDIKTIPDASYIQIKTPTDSVIYNGVGYVIPYLLNNDYLQEDVKFEDYLYQKRSVIDGSVLNNNALNQDTNDFGQLVTVPNGFTLQLLEVLSVNVKTCTVIVHYTKKGAAPSQLKFASSDVKVFNFSPSVDRLTLSISQGLSLSSGGNTVCLVRFEVKDVTYINNNVSGGITLYPIFLYTYKPKIEDAYALLRTCAYYGLKDANFDDSNHPLKDASYFSDNLKKFGSLGGGDIRSFEGGHEPSNPELNTNAVFEASRRLSLFTRILGPSMFEAVHSNDTLRFKRFVAQSGYNKRFRDQKYTGNTEEVFSVVSNFMPVIIVDNYITPLVYKTWWEDNLKLFMEHFYGFYARIQNVNNNPLSATIDAKGNATQNFINTGTTFYTYPYYTGFNVYVFDSRNQGSLYAKLDNDIIKEISNKNVATIVNANNVEIGDAEFLVNYDSFVTSIDNDKTTSAGSFIYFQFEDKFGEKYFRLDNGGNKVYQARRFDNFTPIVDGPNVIGGDKFELQDLVDGSVLISKQDRMSFFANGLKIYTFKRSGKALIGNAALSLSLHSRREFYFLDSKGSYISKSTSGLDFWGLNYYGTMSVIDASISSLANDKLEGYDYNDFAAQYLGPKGQIFVTPDDLGTPVGGAFPVGNPYMENGVQKDEQVYELNDVKLMELTNIIYNNYKDSNVQYYDEENKRGVFYVESGDAVWTDLTAFTKEEYNKYLAGYRLLISSFPNQIPSSKDALTHSYTIEGKQEAWLLSVQSKDFTANLDEGSNIVNVASTKGLSAGQELHKVSGLGYFKDLSSSLDNTTIVDVISATSFTVNSNHFTPGNITFTAKIYVARASVGSNATFPLWQEDVWSNTLSFKVTVNVNTRRKIVNINEKSVGEIINVPIYLSVENSIASILNPTLSPIIRDGSVVVKRTGRLIDTTEAVPDKRDAFQGIAPNIDTTRSGSLLKFRQYKVTGGSIGHNGQVIGNAGLFIAQSAQYESLSGSPIVTPTNGIMEIAFPSSFSNEWCFWMNFLPVSPFNSSIYKRESYADVNSPFIDRCHLNSSLIPKSAENKHLNSGLSLSYMPEAPPSYRYLPLIMPNKKGYAYENVAVPSLSSDLGSNSYIARELQKNFYSACPAFNKPYKIKKAYTDSAYPGSVFIQLDRNIDGWKNADSASPSETVRTDFNALGDWSSGTTPLRFRIGDASITNSEGLFQSTSHTANQYLGSYYPRFFFLKLIPKAFSDENLIDNGDTDSPTNHEMIKQAELYLEAMREGFTANSLAATSGNLPCENIKGHLTPPDLKYDQLFMNATTTGPRNISGIGTTRGYFGNKYPSLLPSSINFNLRPSGVFDGYVVGPSTAKRFDNPRGFGAIPFVNTYLESYASIAKAVNSLVYFRVPFPLNYEQTVNYYGVNEALTGTATNPAGNSGVTLQNVDGPTSVSSIVGDSNYKYSIGPLNLRNDEGTLQPSSAGQYYRVTGVVNNTTQITTNAILEKFYVTASLHLTGIDGELRDTAYNNIKDILPAYPSAYATEQTTKNFTFSTSKKSSDPYYIQTTNQGDRVMREGTHSSDIKCISGKSEELIPPPLKSTPLFYNFQFKTASLTGIGRFNAYSYSSYSINLIDTGFQIAKWKTANLIKN